MWRARLKGPSKLSKTMDANLDFAFVENAFVLVVSKIWRGLMGWALLGSPLLEPPVFTRKSKELNYYLVAI